MYYFCQLELQLIKYGDFALHFYLHMTKDSLSNKVFLY